MQPEEADRPLPTSVRCPSIDAAAILAVANGELSLRREPRVGADPPPADPPPAGSSEVDKAAAGAIVDGQTGVIQRRPKQPDRLKFDAADIYELSRAPHPWQAETIVKADQEPRESAATDGGAEAGGPKLLDTPTGGSDDATTGDCAAALGGAPGPAEPQHAKPKDVAVVCDIASRQEAAA